MFGLCIVNKGVHNGLLIVDFSVFQTMFREWVSGVPRDENV